MTVTPTAPPKLKRQYPHVDGVTDWHAQQSLRLLWDRIFALEARLQGVVGTAGDLVSQGNALEDGLTSVDQKADEALALAQRTAAEVAAAVAGPVPGTDFGLGDLGCGTAGPTGDITGPLTPETAGQIVCGVGNEYPALLAGTVDQPTRDANRDELLDRMIWHLNAAGFPSKRYVPGDPWRLLLDALGPAGPPVRQYAYRVLTYDDEGAASGFADPMETVMYFGGMTLGETTPPDAGIAD